MGLLDAFKPKVEIPAGSYAVGMYIYFPEHLPKMVEGDELVVEYVPKMTTLKDAQTEGAFAYKGKVFGCTFRDDVIATFKRAAKHGRVFCTMVHRGINAAGYPQLSLVLPEKKSLSQYLKSLDS